MTNYDFLKSLSLDDFISWLQETHKNDVDINGYYDESLDPKVELFTSITAIDEFDVRTINCLRRCGFTTLRDILVFNSSELPFSMIRNYGKHSHSLVQKYFKSKFHKNIKDLNGKASRFKTFWFENGVLSTSLEDYNEYDIVTDYFGNSRRVYRQVKFKFNEETKTFQREENYNDR